VRDYGRAFAVADQTALDFDGVKLLVLRAGRQLGFGGNDGLVLPGLVYVASVGTGEPCLPEPFAGSVEPSLGTENRTWATSSRSIAPPSTTRAGPARRLARRRGGFVEAAGGVYQEERGRRADLVDDGCEILLGEGEPSGVPRQQLVDGR
jgi:hypothetical protein